MSWVLFGQWGGYLRTLVSVEMNALIRQQRLVYQIDHGIYSLNDMTSVQTMQREKSWGDSFSQNPIFLGTSRGQQRLLSRLRLCRTLLIYPLFLIDKDEYRYSNALIMMFRLDVVRINDVSSSLSNCFIVVYSGSLYPGIPIYHSKSKPFDIKILEYLYFSYVCTSY